MIVSSTFLFDLDDTLLDFANSQKTALTVVHARFFSALLSFADLEAAYRTINHELWSLNSLGRITLADLRAKRFSELIEYTGTLSKVDPGEVMRTYEALLASHAQLLPGARETLEMLKPLAKIGIVTNGIANIQRKRLQISALAELVDDIIISEEVGMAKPDPEVFHLACTRLGKVAQECIVVGDSLVTDGAGAHAAGMDFWWINMHNKSNTALNPVPVAAEFDSMHAMDHYLAKRLQESHHL